VTQLLGCVACRIGHVAVHPGRQAGLDGGPFGGEGRVEHGIINNTIPQPGIGSQNAIAL